MAQCVLATKSDVLSSISDLLRSGSRELTSKSSPLTSCQTCLTHTHTKIVLKCNLKHFKIKDSPIATSPLPPCLLYLRRRRHGGRGG